MIRRWLESRTFRKFLRNRMAIVALFVIGMFVAMAFAISLFPKLDKDGNFVFGLITLEETKAYVGPANVPGLGYQSKPDRRANTNRTVAVTADSDNGRPGLPPGNNQSSRPSLGLRQRV